MRAICPGSFDPVTHGHLDIVVRASRMFDEVLVAVGRNSAKNYLFSPDERAAMLADATSELPNVRVDLLDGLLVDYCREREIDVIVKGLRFAGDFEFELQMAQMNFALSGIETIMLPTAAKWAHLSSTMIREVAKLGGDVTQFVTPAVAERIRGKMATDNQGGRA
ncbi:pantetheine-phosphate adenylyltransferase [Propioniciclava sinopodophylli]|uniref:Phosphopantetheine adenylyltransferase n=1 Tax=Propioniciclava sinopodophylli TaxID=1837344 RepID=A0A4Q9KDA6_9ACTN|nr:pantetheine-phosphate adenylyltransferase [Propioniciclava sinopodophylli]TBT84322.1 pantetheine-phosphate adenylyltransferase [Propioniciclava sinopodophylli]